MAIRMYHRIFTIYDFQLYSWTTFSRWPQPALDAENLELAATIQQLRGQEPATFQDGPGNLLTWFGTPGLFSIPEVKECILGLPILIFPGTAEDSGPTSRSRNDIVIFVSRLGEP